MILNRKNRLIDLSSLKKKEYTCTGNRMLLNTKYFSAFSNLMGSIETGWILKSVDLGLVETERKFCLIV